MESGECLNCLGNPTEVRISYYIKVDAIPVCRRHKCKVRPNCKRRRLCKNVPRRSFLSREWPRVEFFSRSYTRHASPLYIYISTDLHARAHVYVLVGDDVHVISAICTQEVAILETVRRAMLNCKKQINARALENFRTLEVFQ